MKNFFSIFVLRTSFFVDTLADASAIQATLATKVIPMNAKQFRARTGFRGTIDMDGFELRPLARRAKDSRPCIKVTGRFSPSPTGTRVAVRMEYNWLMKTFYYLLLVVFGSAALVSPPSSIASASVTLAPLVVPLFFWFDAREITRDVVVLLTRE